MPFDRRPLFLEFLDHEEYVELDHQLRPGEVTRAIPIEGSRTAFLLLRAPDGSVVRAEIPQARLDGLLALQFPEDFKAGDSSASATE